MFKRQPRAGDVSGLLARFSQLRAAAVRRVRPAFPIIVIQEAGLDGSRIRRVL